MAKENLSDLLEDVEKNKHFLLHMGTNISNLRQLSEALDIMADNTFNHHVNASKNDFANWVKHVVGDEELAASIEKLRDRKSIASKVRDRVSYLERKRSQNVVCPKDFLTCGATDFVLGAVVGFVVGMIVAVLI